MDTKDNGYQPPYAQIAALIDSSKEDDTLDLDNRTNYAPHPSEVQAGFDRPESTGIKAAGSVVGPSEANAVSSETWIRCVEEPQNDTGNGQRLLHHFGDDLLHVRNVGWHAWAHTHWEREGGNEIATRYAQTTAARIAREADVMAASSDEQRLIDAADAARGTLVRMEAAHGADARKTQRWKKLMDVVEAGAAAAAGLKGRKSVRRKHSVSSGNTGKIKGMLDQASVHRTVTMDELDADELAFNLKNGTLRFRCVEQPDPDASDYSDKMLKHWYAELTPHSRGDNVTKVAPVEYDPNATCPTFEAALRKFLPIEPVRNFVQRFHGYALTGLTGEQCFVFSYGTGANWKSTFVEVVADVMGPYCATINFESLSGDQQRTGSQASPDLARLPGARLVRASEPERGVQFKESLIKSLTGGEPMLVRSLNKEFFEFRPTFKLVLSGNHKPEIGGVDHGIWRRVKFVPWPVTIADRERRPMDEVLSEILPERSGILNWLIAGALDYLNGGLRTPCEVIEATAEYRDEMDPVGTFVDQCVESIPAKPDGSSASNVYAREMYDAYESWAVANAVRAWKEKSFGMAMSQKGFLKKRTNRGMIYLHVMLKNVPQGSRRRAGDALPQEDDEEVPV
jgi:putative DNA primase/helicase